MNGYGKYVEQKGQTYEGQWKDSKRHGRGIFVDEDGSRYEGGRTSRYCTTIVLRSLFNNLLLGWADDHKSGKGRMHLPNGDAFIGGK
jgi:hypothetical protein